MALAKGLRSILDDRDEPLAKRLKIADNAFNSPDLPLQHREAFLLKWSLQNADKNVSELVNSWLKSNHFKELDRNDISNSDTESIIQLVIQNLNEEAIQDATLQSSLLLLENTIFQQYFKYNLTTYCTLLSNIVQCINCSLKIQDFFKNEFVFYKSIIIEDDFYKHFLEICLPVLVKISIKFENDDTVFNQISKVIQRCIYYRRSKNFEDYLKKFFNEEVTIEKNPVPKTVIKYICQSYSNDLKTTRQTYKLLYHAFCCAYDDFGLVFKMFVLLNEIIGFDLVETFELKKTSKLSPSGLALSISVEVFLDLVTVVSELTLDLDYKIKTVSLTDCLKMLVLTLISVSPINSTVYQIISRIIIINPLIVESTIENLITNAMVANNELYMSDYIKFLIGVLEVFSKLHRIQNLIAKLVPSLKSGLEQNNSFVPSISFRGVEDLKKEKSEVYKIENILPSEVLEYFSFCVTNLASWQVMNLFKTMIFHLDTNIQELQNNNSSDASFIAYMEILGTLTCCVLSSVRIAEHTVSQAVVEKFVKSLNELKAMLKRFGKALLNIEHNQLLVRVFLNLSYSWAEIYMMLNYYSSDVTFEKHIDANYAACNITYLHSYLSAKQWCLLSERINNFGEKPCKELMLKLFIQKLRAYVVLEQSYNSDIATNVAQNISNTINDNWKSIMLDKFLIKNLLDKVELEYLIIFAENIVNNLDEINNQQKQNIMDSQLLLTVINYVILSKLNKLVKQKKKSEKKPLSCQVFSVFKPELCLGDVSEDVINAGKQAFHSVEIISNDDFKFNEKKTLHALECLKKFPVIYSSSNIQKLYLLYLFALHKDIKGMVNLRQSVESLIIGLLHHTKFNLLDIFEPDTFCLHVINNFTRFEMVFQQLTDSSIKNIKQYESCISCVVEHIKEPNFMKCAIIFLNIHYKIKKMKLPADVKNLSNELKSKICNKLLKLILKRKPEDYLIGPFAHVLKNLSTSPDSGEQLADLTKRLPDFTEYALNNYTNVQGSLLLFNVLLNNKNQLACLEDDFSLKIWNWLKKLTTPMEQNEEYSQLIILIFGLIPNDQFSGLTQDLLDITIDAVKKTNWQDFNSFIKTWESIVACNFNPVKLKLWQKALEELLQELFELLQSNSCNPAVRSCIVKFVETIIHTNQLFLTSQMVDMLLLTPSLILDNVKDGENETFFNCFEESIKLMEALLKYRRPLIMDRLTVFLQQYSKLLDRLCLISDSEKGHTSQVWQMVSNSAHHLEKLTRNISACQKDMSRISMYIIADILDKYERITLYSTVKIHLNNCIYTLVALCDQHAISYLMRVLSNASTEMFKILYDNYKKYYRFTGKV